VYIIGGDYVIPDDLIYAQSFNTHITIQRIYGAHMDGTAVAVLSELSSLSSPTTAYVINGAIDASCVTAASLSTENGYPVLLVDYSGPTDATLAAISDFGLTDIIILGEGVTQKTISALERILGEEHVTKQGEE
ncbi:MAG: cell wall-binding repeat-containing protein, partial [Eubacteriales bacterium]